MRKIPSTRGEIENAKVSPLELQSVVEAKEHFVRLLTENASTSGLQLNPKCSIPEGLEVVDMTCTVKTFRFGLIEGSRQDLLYWCVVLKVMNGIFQ